MTMLGCQRTCRRSGRAASDDDNIISFIKNWLCGIKHASIFLEGSQFLQRHRDFQQVNRGAMVAEDCR